MSAPVHFRTELPEANRDATAGLHGSGYPRGDQARTRRMRLPARPSARMVRAAVALLVLAGLLVALATGVPEAGDGAVATLAVFGLAVWFWVFTDVDDTFVALCAAVVLAVLGLSDAHVLFGSLGDDIMWLLIAAFIIAYGVATSGLATRAAAFVVTGACGARSLTHLVTSALVVTAFAIPATSGRAALVLPVFVALVGVLRDRPALVRMLAVLMPTVVLLSAVASLTGAGAHLITSQLLETAGLEGFDFASWLVLGLPLAFVSSHIAAELVLWLFTSRDERSRPLRVTAEEFEQHGSDAATPIHATGPMTVGQSRAALLLVSMVVLWSTEALHGVPPALVALVGALVATSPRYGSVRLGDAVKQIPWSLLLFMAATVTLGHALGTSGAADLLASVALGPLSGSAGAGDGAAFVVVVIVVSALAHLVIQSRSARSAVLIPIIISLAPGFGVNPVAAALASTAAAGLCHTLPSSAKPMTIFSDVHGTETFSRRDLLRLSCWLTPLMIAVYVAFAWVVWPALGLELFLEP